MRGKLFPIGSDGSVLNPELIKLKEKHGTSKIKARWTGEKRPPRKGEWYLSGAIVEAWQAPNDLTTPFHIAELVEVETVERVKRVLR